MRHISWLALQASVVILGVAICSANAVAESKAISLAGEWRFALDREDAGSNEKWFDRELSDRIKLPGVLQAQGYGDEISISTKWVLSLYDRFWYLRADYQAYTEADNVKVPFVCQPPRHYLGVAWYQRDIEIPPDWQARRIVLFLERAHWETTVWLDDRKVGSHNSLVAPHEYDLGSLATGKHRLSIRVDNRMLMKYRPDAHSVSDSLNSTWNGIVGRIELSATDLVWIEDLQVYPRLATQSVLIKGRIGNANGKEGHGQISVWSGDAEGVSGEMAREPKDVEISWTAEGGAFETELSDPHGGFRRWDEFGPRLYFVAASIKGSSDVKSVPFGLREFKTEGGDFIINGRKTNLRGTHHGGDFPLTGYSPTDVEYWRKLFRTCKEWGLNHVRFHSFCPPDAAFTAADEIGMYLQPECGMWNEISPGTAMERMLYEETDRMIKAYGNHPSFVLLSPSNEPKGNWKKSLPPWVEHYRKADPRRLYTTGTGWSLIDEPQPVRDKVDYLAVHRIGSKLMRGDSAWFGRDYARSIKGVDVPNIVHELGQWCAYPDYDIIGKFTGYMRPGNFEIFHDSLAAHGLLHKNKEFALASGRFQLACYKEEIEANLRTPGLGGFQLLDLHDYVGQGTALVGVLDPFWEEKDYVTAKEWRQFCNTTVPLARLHSRVFKTTDRFEIEVEVAHFGPEPIRNAVLAWMIASNKTGMVVAKGHQPVSVIPIGKSFALGKITADIAKLAAPEAYRLIVFVGEAVDSEKGWDGGSGFVNKWNFCLYPDKVDDVVPKDVLVTSLWDDAESRLVAGGKVLFLPRITDLDWSSPPLDRVPVFWNRLMNPAWSRMLGLWCDTKHSALAEFPTEAHCDGQWTQIVHGIRAMNLDRLPSDLQPIVQAIDDWNRNWKLGVVYECKVGAGRLIVCTVDLNSDNPVARQLRRSMLDYMAGSNFQPKTEVSAAQFRDVLFDTRIMKKLDATVQAEGSNPSAVIDGDPNTYWLVGAPARGVPARPHPHELTISFPNAAAMNGLVFMPRQNDRDHQGDIRGYTVQVSNDSAQWREVLKGELVSSFDPQTVKFPETVTAKQLKLTALSGFGEDPRVDRPTSGMPMSIAEELHPAGVEPTTFGFGGRHSIQLSYGCKNDGPE